MTDLHGMTELLRLERTLEIFYSTPCPTQAGSTRAGCPALCPVRFSQI